MSSFGSADALLEKLRELPPGKLAEVEDFVDFLRDKERRRVSSREERLRAAAQAGHITPSEPGHKRSSVQDVPPVTMPGKPPSEMVIEDRR
jgi:hypothetical protein